MTTSALNLLRRIGAPLAALLLLGLAYRQWGGAGLALAGGGVLMWLLLHFTRAMGVMRRAAQRPIGSVASAVMLNARLRRGQTLLHVVALTRALGEARSPEGEQPEVYRWADAGGAQVTATFAQGRLQQWELVRPVESQAPPTTP